MSFLESKLFRMSTDVATTIQLLVDGQLYTLKYIHIFTENSLNGLKTACCRSLKFLIDLKEKYTK